jgi:hypothetical protein
MRKLDTYRGICEFKKSYQPRINLVKDENGDLLADFHIMNREEFILSATKCIQCW